MIGIEELDEQDLREFAAFYVRLVTRAKAARAVKEAQSIDEEGCQRCPETGRRQIPL